MIGRFALVLHSHLPWLRGHGRWPVGEEWLNQAVATSYIPVLDALRRLADTGARDLVTIGVTQSSQRNSTIRSAWQEPARGSPTGCGAPRNSPLTIPGRRRARPGPRARR